MNFFWVILREKIKLLEISSLDGFFFELDRRENEVHFG